MVYLRTSVEEWERVAQEQLKRGRMEKELGPRRGGLVGRSRKGQLGLPPGHKAVYEMLTTGGKNECQLIRHAKDKGNKA